MRRRSKSPQRHHKGSFSICAGALTFHIAKLCFGSFARFQSVVCEEKHFLAEATSLLNLAIWFGFSGLVNNPFERVKGFACAIKLRSTIDSVTQGG